jgi:hypothetical protein
LINALAMPVTVKATATSSVILSLASLVILPPNVFLLLLTLA